MINFKGSSPRLISDQTEQNERQHKIGILDITFFFVSRNFSSAKQNFKSNKFFPDKIKR